MSKYNIQKTKQSLSFYKTYNQKHNTRQLLRNPSKERTTKGENSQRLVSESVMINLEDLLAIEKELYFLIHHFNTDKESESVCWSWWSIINDNTLQSIDSVFEQDKTWPLIKNSLILNCMIPGILLFMLYNATSPSLTLIKTLCFYYHQCFLHFTEAIISKISAKNTYKSSLESVIQSRKLRSTFRASLTAALTNIKKLVRYHFAVYHQKEASSFRNSVSKILNNLNSMSARECRGIMQQALGFVPISVNTHTQMKLPPSTKPFTLVLDLDETLVHYSEVDGHPHYSSRPFLQQFLEETAQLYEIVVFTASLKEYADWILNEVDPHKMVTHRLYRENTMRAGTFYLKDIAKLGRDLSKIVIVDNIAENFQLQPDNGIHIKSWYNDPDDFALRDLCKLLVLIAQEGVEDIRKPLQVYREQVLEDLRLKDSN